MKTDWYLKLCQSTLQEQRDLIEHKCGKELNNLHISYTYWVVDSEDSMRHKYLFQFNLQLLFYFFPHHDHSTYHCLPMLSISNYN